MKSRSRIIITRVIVLLLLGAIVNVAVAWGCAMWSPVSRTAFASLYDAEEIPSQIRRVIPEDWLSSPPPKLLDDDDVKDIWIYGLLGWTLETSAGTGFAKFEFDSFVHQFNSLVFGWDKKLCVLQVGWPAPCLQTYSMPECEFNPPGAQINWIRGIPVSSVLKPLSVRIEWLTVPRSLPYMPLWPGFAINTIFYAAILALLFYGPGKVRRFVRVRRWRCPACGFIIAPGTCANGLCSECGATLPGRLIRPATPGAGGGEEGTPA